MINTMDEMPKQPKQILCIAQATEAGGGQTESVCENDTFPGTITLPALVVGFAYLHHL